ncbi:hypothetical protein F5Y18DRAFT_369797 [Xylariaceae sp. FL1019]|nr:hypothetical protein F5Y18DRAFT_369797 [Xylariaceae sp. FL1019]
MHYTTFFTIATAVVVGTVSAMPAAEPLTTPAPVLDDLSRDSLARRATTCTSEVCYNSYTKCGSGPQLTFVTNCFTPCGTKTSPPPYVCPTEAAALSS